MADTAVVLLNLGGPDSIEAVQPFLFNLFSDSDIFPLPFAQRIFAGSVSRLRAPAVEKKYLQIGGKSPILQWTETQRSMLEKALESSGFQVEVHMAMRYWHPLIRDVAKRVSAGPYQKIVLLPLYPHYSKTTTGSSFNEWDRNFTGDKDRVVKIESFFDHPLYISALSQRIDETLLRFREPIRDNVRIVFSAHGTPQRLADSGDPYQQQIEGTVRKIMAFRGGNNAHYLCYQSRVGPMKWLGPSIGEMIQTLADKGEKNLLIVPVSFVSDHIETQYELEVEYRELADRHHIENFEVTEGLNDSETFIAALKEISIKALSQ